MVQVMDWVRRGFVDDLEEVEQIKGSGFCAKMRTTLMLSPYSDHLDDQTICQDRSLAGVIEKIGNDTIKKSPSEELLNRECFAVCE